MFQAYEERALPWLLHHVMGYRRLEPYRHRAAARVGGRVLEIGIGSALNFPFYPAQIDAVVGVDLSAPLLARAHRAKSAVRARVELLEGDAEALPFEAASFDSALVTWSFCSIHDPARAFAELARVLRPGGELAFVEHARSPELRVARWQERLTPLWSRVSGGCHMDRDPEALARRAGFRIDAVERGYLRRPKVLTYTVEGLAVAP